MTGWGQVPPPLPDGWRERLQALGTAVLTPTTLELSALVPALPQHLRTPAKELLRHRPFADEGARDSTLYALLAAMARAWPYAQTEAIVTLFAPALGAMGYGAPGSDDVREKWSRLAQDAQGDAAEEAARKQAQIRAAWAWAHQSDRVDSVDAGPVPLAVYQGRTWYVRVDNSWVGPWSRDDLTPAMLRDLGALYSMHLGDEREFVRAYARRAERIDLSLAHARTSYDPTRNVLEVAAAPLRHDLEPVRDDRVTEWLQDWAGAYAPQLFQWLSGLLRLDHPLRALVLSGQRGLGKSLFLEGIGRLWPSGPAKMRDVLGKRFNGTMLSSPLAVADDDISRAEDGSALVAYLRESVNDRTQRLERKHHEVAKVRGCMRYAVATNDAFALIRQGTHWDLNTASLDAFGDRLLHLPLGEHSRNSWKRHGLTPSELVQGDVLARWVLWWREMSVAAAPSDRFWVGPGETDLARFAAVSSGLRGEVLYRLGSHLAGDVRAGGVEDTDTHLLVKSSRFYDLWEDRPHRATARTVALAVKALGERELPERKHAVSKEQIKWYMSYCG